MLKWTEVQAQLLHHLLALSDCSNFELGKSAWLLGLLPSETITADNIHYQIRTKLGGLRDTFPTHSKRYTNKEQRLVSLSGCRLFSSARVQFSVRLIPVTYYGVEDKKRDMHYGVLGVVQELCSRLIRAEMLGLNVIDIEEELPGDVIRPKLESAPSLKYAKKATDIYHLDEQDVIDFVARSITIPNLKIATIHFPKMNLTLDDPNDVSTPPSLIRALLGQHQPNSCKQILEEQFIEFAGKVIAKAETKSNWGMNAHKLRLKSDIFKLTMPSVEQEKFVDFCKPCGKDWVIHNLTREIKKRVDRHNTHFHADTDTLSPVMKLWIANLCYHPSRQDDSSLQAKRLEALIKKVWYQKSPDSNQQTEMFDFALRYFQSHC